MSYYTPEDGLCKPQQVRYPIGVKVNTKKVRLRDEILALWDTKIPIAQIATALDCGTNTVRRALDAARPGERIARATVIKPEEQCCKSCGVTQPVSDYPPRADRPGKYHARCYACLRDWYRTWQSANPERNREGVRRRRARLRKARTEPYRDADVYSRDDGVCWFCHEQVDLGLSYPDPMAPVVHHLHPIAKRGPDILKNVALAHYTCNHRAKDSYDSPLSSYVVAPMPPQEARKLLVEHHYLHRATPSSYYFGLYDDDRVVGVVAFGTPPSHRINISVCDDRSVRVLCLNRLWISDSVPFGAGSFFLSRSLRALPPAIIVAYSDTEAVDPRYGTTHTGGVYRACSFFYAGASRPNIEWRVLGQGHNVGASHPDAIQSHVSPKARYWTTTGSQAQRKKLRAVSKWPAISYVGRPDSAALSTEPDV